MNWISLKTGRPTKILPIFTDHVKEIDGVRVYGHSDYSKKDPSIGWRFSDA